MSHLFFSYDMLIIKSIFHGPAFFYHANFPKNAFEKVYRQDLNTWMGQKCCMLTLFPPSLKDAQLMHKIPHVPFLYHWIPKLLFPRINNPTPRGFPSCLYWDESPHGRKFWQIRGGSPSPYSLVPKCQGTYSNN